MIINNEFVLDIPSNFKVLNEEEIKKVYQTSSPHVVATSTNDEEMISVIWQKASTIFLKFSNLSKQAKKNAKAVEKVYNGKEFKLFDYVSKKVNNIEYEGYTYSFNGKKTIKYAITLLFKGEKNIYSISLYKLDNNFDDIDALLQNMNYK